MAKKEKVAPEPLSRTTWETRTTMKHADRILSAFLTAGLPISSGEETEDGGAEIACVAEVKDDNIEAVVVCQNRDVFHFAPDTFELHFWKFAADNYYWVTQTMSDRQKIADLTGVEIKNVKGKVLARSKEKEISRVSLKEMMGHLGVS